MANIFQQQLTPEKPKILAEERVFVYVPRATTDSPGIASFNNIDFGVDNGRVSLLWPMQMDVEQLANPIVNVSRIKVTDDEFVNTGNTASVRNPVTGTIYTSRTAEVKFNRESRNAFLRPELVMLDSEHDFNAIIDSGTNYVTYRLKHNNAFDEPSLIQLNKSDFEYDSSNVIDVRWPYANNPETGTNRTNGFGLVKIATNATGFLSYDANGLLQVDKPKMFADTAIKPTYGGTATTGFTNIADYVDANGYSKRDVVGHPLIALTKESVGLNKLENKAFNEYVYTDFGSGMQKYFTDEFGKKLDKTTWNSMFGDWSPPADSKNTPQKWFEELEEQDESIWEAIHGFRLFLGYFDDLNHLTALYPPSRLTFGSTAYLLDARSYFAVHTMNVNEMADTDAEATSIVPPKDEQGRWLYNVYVTGSRATGNRFEWTFTDETYHPYGKIGDARWVDYLLATDEELAPFIEEQGSTLSIGAKIGIRETDEVFVWDGQQANKSTEIVYYEWYDTGLTELSIMDFIEEDASVYLPDGVASAGMSGKWAQSDHVHPTDETRLAKDLFQSTTATVYSQFSNASNDFLLKFWEIDAQGHYISNHRVNIPYVRKSKMIHNWNGQTTFTDTASNGDSYWAGTAEEFVGQLEYIPTNSFMMVDDNEGFIAESFLSEEALDLHGITINEYMPNEKFVITTTDTMSSLIGVPVTLTLSTSETGFTRYKLDKIDLGTTTAGKVIQTTLLSNDRVTLTAVPTLSAGQVISASATGGIEVTSYHANSVLTTNKTGQSVTLPSGRVLRSDDNNLVSTFDMGNTAENLIVSDGFGGIKLKTFINQNMPLISGVNGVMTEASFSADNVLITRDSQTPTVLSSGQLLLSRSGNEVETFNSGTIDGRILVSNGSGGVRTQTNLTANKLLYAGANNQLLPFPMTIGDVGKYVSVDSTGNPTLTSIVHPNTLPITVFTSNPGQNMNGMVISKLSADPGVFYSGVLYLW